MRVARLRRMDVARVQSSRRLSERVGSRRDGVVRPSPRKVPETEIDSRFPLHTPARCRVYANPIVGAITQVAVSPDGKRRHVAVCGGTNPRAIDALDPHARRCRAGPLAGTERAADPFWSPDSQHGLAFSPTDRLKRIERHDGSIRDICEASLNAARRFVEHRRRHCVRRMPRLRSARFRARWWNRRPEIHGNVENRIGGPGSCPVDVASCTSRAARRRNAASMSAASMPRTSGPADRVDL